MRNVWVRNLANPPPHLDGARHDPALARRQAHGLGRRGRYHAGKARKRDATAGVAFREERRQEGIKAREAGLRLPDAAVLGRHRAMNVIGRDSVDLAIGNAAP